MKNARICKLNNQTQELKNSIIASQFDEVCIKQLNYKTFVPVKIPFFQDKTENFIQQIISNPWAQFEEWNVSQPIKIHSVIKVRDRLKVLVVLWSKHPCKKSHSRTGKCMHSKRWCYAPTNGSSLVFIYISSSVSCAIYQVSINYTLNLSIACFDFKSKKSCEHIFKSCLLNWIFSFQFFIYTKEGQFCELKKLKEIFYTFVLHLLQMRYAIIQADNKVVRVH